MPSVLLTRVRRTIILTLQGSADSGTVASAARMLAEELEGRETRGVIVELSACEVIDVEEFSGLLKLTQTLEWLGLVGVIAGLRPGLVAYLVSARISLGTVRAALDLEQALLAIESQVTYEADDSQAN